MEKRYVTLLLVECAALLYAFEMYDPQKEICCNGTVHHFEEGMRCCAKEIYHPKDHICCFHKLLPLPAKGLHGCCGDQDKPVVFPYGRHDCCKGEVISLDDAEHLKVADSYYGCCDTRIYYPERQSCCDGVIRPGNESCCGAQNFDDENNICCQTFTKQRTGIITSSAIHPRVGDRSSCCGLQPMDWKQEMCCGGEIKPRNQSIWCCGGRELYDSANFICCHGRVHPKEQDKECCWSSGALYDPSTEICCESEIASLSSVSGKKTACCAATHVSRTAGLFVGHYNP